MAPTDARQKIDQIRRKKKSEPVKVKDLRQLIGKKKNSSKTSSQSTSNGRITRASGMTGVRDLRDTNRKLAARKNQPGNGQGLGARRGDRDVAVKSRSFPIPDTRKTARLNGQGGSSKQNQPQQFLYVPPHLRNQPATYIIAQAPAPVTKSNLAMDNVPEPQGASILISNLMPSITQSDIIELFGDIGVMVAVNMINQTTALVTYQNSSDAVRAVKVYHNRLLDGKPMLVNMMPTTTPTSNVRSRISLG